MDSEIVSKRTILLGLGGSHSYGLNVEGSDIDGKGICVGLKEHYLGFTTFEQKDAGWDISKTLWKDHPIKIGEDLVVYELRKYLQLAADANPNILELLWLKPEQYLLQTEVGAELIKHRQLFMTSKCKWTFSGYAHSQLKKIQAHRKWLLDPPDRRPEPQDFGLGLGNKDPMTKEQLHAFYEFLYILVRDAIEYAQPAEDLYNILIARIDYKGLFKQHPLSIGVLPYVQSLTRSSDDFISLLHASQEYRGALTRWDAYQNWKLNRNKKRAATEAAIGYDSKHGMHLVRLLSMGIEILETGELIVDRGIAGDRDDLMAIRNCEWPYEKLMDYVSLLEQRVEDAFKQTRLPRSCDRTKVNELCIELVEIMGWYDY
jgi:uncharacterized protein